MKSKIKYFVDCNNLLMASGQWPTTKIGALRESIRKWEFIAKHPGIINREGTTCACCQLATIACGNCLVAEGGYPNCLETPYMLYLCHSTAENALKEVRFLKRILKTNSSKASSKGKGEQHEKQD